MRRHYLDNIKWVVILLVLFAHTIIFVNMYNVTHGSSLFYPSRAIDYIIYILDPWIMGIMFLVSGIGTQLALEKKSEKKFMIERFKKLFVPGFVALFLFHWINGYFFIKLFAEKYGEIPFAGMSPLRIYLVCVQSGRGVLWFIELLFLYSLLICFVHRFEKKCIYNWVQQHQPGFILLVIGGFLMTYVSEQCLPDEAPFELVELRPAGFLCRFLMGYYIFSNETVLIKLSKYRVQIYIATILSELLLIMMIPTLDITSPIYLKQWTYSLNSWLATLSVLLIFKDKVNICNKITRLLSKSSFGWYIMQNFVCIIGIYILITYTHLPLVWLYVVYGLVIFGLTPLLYEIVKCIPVLRFILLGIEKKS